VLRLGTTSTAFTNPLYDIKQIGGVVTGFIAPLFELDHGPSPGITRKKTLARMGCDQVPPAFGRSQLPAIALDFVFTMIGIPLLLGMWACFRDLGANPHASTHATPPVVAGSG